MIPLPTRELVLRASGAVGVIAGIYSFLHFVLPATMGLDSIALLNLTLASASATLMNLIGVAVVQSGTHLTFHGASLVVTNECNGLGAWLLIVGAMSALRAVPLQWRVLGMAASAVAVSALNVTRIAALCYLQAERPAWFGPFHEQIAPLLVVLTACLCLTCWTRTLEYAHQR
jgi:exosortase/archaeosortase family protein